MSAKLKSSLVIVLVTLTLPFLMPLFNFRILIFNLGFYQREFERHYVYYLFPDRQQVDDAAVELIGYLANKSDLTTDFFNQKEKGHLVDVKDLIQTTLLAFNALLIIFVVSLTYLAMTKRYRASGYGFVLGGLTSLAMFVGIALLVERRFFSLFLQFHFVAFDNNLWMLDPPTDNLIRMFPAGFFYDSVQRIAKNSIVAAVLFVVLGAVLILASSASTTFRPYAVEPVENTAGDSSAC